MKPIKLHITLVFLLVWSFSFCQQYTNYSLEDGLPSNHVYRITQDYDGFIWIITDKGMSKFDGKTFKNFTIKEGLPSNDIWNIRITPDNKVWFFTKANKLGYILDDKVYAFPSDQNKMLGPYYISQSGNDIAFNDGQYFFRLKDSVWQSTKNNPFEYSRNKYPVLHPSVRSVVLSLHSTFYELETKKENVRISMGNNSTLPWGNAKQINDSLYLSNNKYKYGVINFNTKKIKTYTAASQNINGNLNYFRAHNVNNEIQFTGLHFVSYVDDKYRPKNLQSIPEALDSHFSFIDKTGNIWSATFNKGVYVLPKAKNKAKYLAHNKKVQELKLINNTVYAAIFNEGFFKVSDTLLPILKNMQFQYGMSSIPELGSVYFSSRNELTKLKDNKFKSLNILIKDSINVSGRKFVFKQDSLYGYNSSGIFKIEPETFTTIDAYNFFGITSISKTEKQLFVGNQQGLFEFKDNSITKLQAHNLFDLPVISQESYDNKRVVIGTDGNGAYVTNGYNAFAVDGANDLSVQEIFVENATTMWLATNKGVHQVTKKDSSYVITRSFYEADGLLSFNTNSVAVKNDSLYVATDTGISVMSLKKEREKQLQKIYIDKILINNKNLANEGFSIHYAANHFISFSIGSIDYSDQGNLSYSYKLNPINKEWISTSSKNINFTDLDPQMYTLELKATNHHNDTVKTAITFEITPLWYQTKWFKILMAVMTILLFRSILNRYKRGIQKKIEVREKAKKKAIYHELHALRSQMNPHFVFNSLNAIQYYMNSNEIELSEKYLVKFSRLIRMFFDFSSEQFITIKQEVKLLNAYLEIEKMRFGDDFKFKIDIDTQLNMETKMPSMLLQPIVENAVNHGLFHQEGNGVISIKFLKQKGNENFTVCVNDNGVGYKKAKEIKSQSIKKHTSKSTKIIIDRLELINNSSSWNITQVITDLTTEAKSGTSVLLTFKKNQDD